jgi:hypothetical protein
MFDYGRLCLQRDTISGAAGKIFFADYCSTQIGSLNSDDSITWTSAFSGNNFSTFGE